MSVPFILPVLSRHGLLPPEKLEACADSVSERRLLQRLVERGELNWERVLDLLESEWAIPWKRRQDWHEDWSERLPTELREAAEQTGVVVCQVEECWQVIANHPLQLAAFTDKGVLVDGKFESWLTLLPCRGSAQGEPLRIEEAVPETVFGDPLRQLLMESCEDSITDIHLEPIDTGGGRVRRRKHGRMLDHGEWSAARWERLMANLLHRGHLPVDRIRFPQEARLEEAGRVYRVSLIPALRGPAVVLRQLPSSSQSLDLEMLGMEAEMAERWRTLMAATRGLLLIVGPTGAGKSTTVRALLQAADPSRRKILSLEDPVETRIPGVQQVTVGASGKMVFAEGIRATLRQAPDILFIGEVRDPESAAAALTASLTGHLVVSTVHARSLSGAVWRLIELGLTPIDLASQLNALLSQRLMRLEGGDRRALFVDQVLAAADRERIRNQDLPVVAAGSEFAEARSRAAALGYCFEADELNRVFG